MEHSIDDKKDSLWPLVLKLVAVAGFVRFGLGPLVHWSFKVFLPSSSSTPQFSDYLGSFIVILMVPIAGACVTWMVADLCWAAWLSLRKEGA